MNEYNLDPEYKKYRQKKKKINARIRKLKVFLCFLSLFLIAGSVLAIMFASGAFKKDAGTTPTPTVTAGGKETAETPLETSSPDVSRKPFTVYIDPGHGYLLSEGVYDTGIGKGSVFYEKSDGKTEADLALSVALKLKNKLSAEGYRVILFREKILDYIIKDGKSAEDSNTAKADLFISIHAYSEGPSKSATRIIYSEENINARKCEEFANTLAMSIAGRGSLGVKNADVISQNYTVCKITHMPSVLIEMINLNNEKDSSLAAGDAWQNDLAAAIASGIKKDYPLKSE